MPRRRSRSRSARPALPRFTKSVYARRLRAERLEDRRMLATLVVQNNLDGDLATLAGDGELSLREAIAIANDPSVTIDGFTSPDAADTIEFDPATFTGGAASLVRLTAGELFITDTLRIDGSTGVDITITGDANGDDIVDANFITDVAASFIADFPAPSVDLLDDNSRVLNFSDITGNLILEELTITGGQTRGFSQGGGGIRFGRPFSRGTLLIIQSTVSGNSTLGSNSGGGGIFVYSGALTLTTSTVSGNSTLESNSDGGGIHSRGRAITLNSSTLSQNSTSDRDSPGGGIYARSGDLRLNSSTISSNSTSGSNSRGGGISTYGGLITLTSSTLSGNSTSGHSSQGTGIYTSRGTIALIDSTVTGTSGGTSIYVSDTGINPSFTLRNSILASNPNNSSARDLRLDPNSTRNIQFSLISNTTGSGIDETTGVGNLLNIEPLLGPLADNGGPTLTHALLPDSPVIDAGSSTLATDQRGLARPLDLVSLSNGLGNGADIGAFEFSAPIAPIGRLPPEVTAFFVTPSALDLSPIRIIEESGSPVTLTLTASSGVFSGPADGIAAGVAASLTDPQTVTLVGSTLDLNAYLNDPANLRYAATPGIFDATLSVTVDATAVGAIEIDAVEVPSLVVDTKNDTLDPRDLQTSLRDAIALANSTPGADTITFDSAVFTGGAASLIRLTNGELEITDTLVIDGSAGVDVTITGDADGDDIVDANFITDVTASLGGTPGAADDLLDDNSPVINFSADAGDLSLEGIKITGGRLGSNFQGGGGVRFLSNGSLALFQSEISGNSAASPGGGIYTNFGEVTLTDSNLNDNSTGSSGGGIFARSGDVTLTSSTAIGNYASFGGGGIATSSGGVTLISSTVSGNSTSGNNSDGGGVLTDGGDVTLISSTLSGNSTSGDFAEGGGIHTLSGSISLTSSTISGNSTSGYSSEGGGIYADSGSVSLTNSTVSGNSTSGDSSEGGGIYVRANNVSLTDSTITGNSSGLSSGGGIVVRYGSSLALLNTILAGNTGGTAPDLQTNRFTTLDIQFSLIGDTTGSVVDEATGVGNLLNVDPLLGPLADNGGPTFTHAPVFGSPAIDAGNSTLSTDQRGLARPVDLVSFVTNGVDGSDIGSFEHAAPLDLLSLFPDTLAVAPEVTSDFDLSTALIIDESGDPVTLTLSVDNGVFSGLGDGGDIGDGVSASLITPQSITLVGLPADLNRYLSDTSNLRYTPPSGVTGTNQAELSISINSATAETIGISIAEIQVVTTASDTVDPLDGLTSLREAITQTNAVSGAETIRFDPTVFTGGDDSLIRLTGGELEITDTLLIDGSTGVDIVITGDADGDDITDAMFVTDVDASSDPFFFGSSRDLLDDNSRVFNFSASTGDLTLDLLTITGGRTTGSGQSTFPDFAVPHNGGGIRFSSAGVLTIANSSISGNSIGPGDRLDRSDRFEGGGIYSNAGAIIVANSTISRNSIDADPFGFGVIVGGGVSTRTGRVTLTDSTVNDNTAKTRFSGFPSGGGIATSSGAITLQSSTVHGNTAEERGGGIFTQTGPITLENSTVSGNTGVFRGGGIYAFASLVAIESSTVTDNTSFSGGSGLYIRQGEIGPSSLALRNSILAGNATFSGTPIADLSVHAETSLTIEFSLIGDTTGSNIDATTGVGNLLGVDPLLGPLADNGGPTLTHALLPGSPAIDAGDPDFVTTTGTDQRGNPFVRVAGGIVDIGAVESQGTPTRAVGDYNGDNVVDAADYTAWRDAYAPTTPVAPLSGADGDGDGLVTLNDRDVWRSHFGFVFTPPAEPAAAAVVAEAPPLRQPAFVEPEPEPETDAAFAALAVVPPPTGVGGSPSLVTPSGSVDLADDEAILLLALAPASGPSDDLAAETTTLDDAFAEEERDETNELELALLP